jgi:small conductance mechanosensitive channel
VRDVVLAAMAGFPGLLAEPPPQVMFTSFADSAITFSLRFWISYRRQVDYVGAKSEAIMRVKQAFDVAGIVIPFPMRTLELPVEVLARLSGAG